MLTESTSFSPIISFFDQPQSQASSSELSRLKDTGCKILCPNNKIFIHFGEFVNGMYLLYKGKADARVMSLQGNKYMIFTMKPLCIFGEAPFLNNHKSNLEIEVHAGSILYFFDKNSIENLLEKTIYLKN